MKNPDDMNGDELNAAVAVEIMGWTWWKSDNVFDRSRPKHYLGTTWYHRGDVQVESPGELYRDWNRDIPNFSTDIAAAWDVAEKLRVSVDACGAGPDGDCAGWWAGIHSGERTGGMVGDVGNELVSFGERAPLAICRAALKIQRHQTSTP